VQPSYVKGVVDDEVLGLLDESTTMVDSLLDNDLARHLEAVVLLGWNELVYERLDGALRHLDRGLHLARTTGQNHLVTYLLAEAEADGWASRPGPSRNTWRTRTGSSAPATGSPACCGPRPSGCCRAHDA
jgi:hypothetical protein